MRRTTPLLALAALFVIQAFAVVGCNPTPTEETGVTSNPPAGVDKAGEGSASNMSTAP